MHRVCVYGIALFFAIAGSALMGGEKQALAGHGCHGCQGAVACGGAADCGVAAVSSGRCAGRVRHACAGRTRRGGGCEGQRLLGRRRGGGRQSADCCGQPVSCCDTVGVDGCGVAAEATPHEATPETPPTEEPGGEAPVEEGAVQ